MIKNITKTKIKYFIKKILLINYIIMYIKKILVLVLVLISTINYSYSDYTLSTKDKKVVINAVTLINKFIDKKWEKYRNIIIQKINLILKRKNLPERTLSVFEKLKKWISLEQKESTTEDNEELIKNEEEIKDDETSLDDHKENPSEENKEPEQKDKDNSKNESELVLENDPVSYDVDSVRDYWLELMNSARKEENLQNYSYDDALDLTARNWTKLAIEKWEIDHKVDPTDSYYDYQKKKTWMEENWVICKIDTWITFSESIAWWEFLCTQDDCTAWVKDIMKKSFDAYMAEKWQSYDAHYKAIIQPEFLKMGLWLGIKHRSNTKYALYLTNHYCTENIK